MKKPAKTYKPKSANPVPRSATFRGGKGGVSAHATFGKGSKKRT